jgi:hypothetical protein
MPFSLGGRLSDLSPGCSACQQRAGDDYVKNLEAPTHVVQPTASLLGEVRPSFSNSLSLGKRTRKLVVLAVAVYTRYTEYILQAQAQAEPEGYQPIESHTSTITSAAGSSEPWSDFPPLADHGSGPQKSRTQSSRRTTFFTDVLRQRLLVQLSRSKSSTRTGTLRSHGREKGHQQNGGGHLDDACDARSLLDS